MLSSQDKTNFQTLMSAIAQGHVVLVELERKSDGKVVAGICATGSYTDSGGRRDRFHSFCYHGRRESFRGF